MAPSIDYVLIGAVAGGVVCCLLLVALIVALIVRSRRKRTQNVNAIQMPPNWTEMASASSERHSIGTAMPPESHNYAPAEMLTDYENASAFDASVNYARFPDAPSQANYAVPSFGAPSEATNGVMYGKLLPDAEKKPPQYAVPFK
jgi:hypothetical protein